MEMTMPPETTVIEYVTFTLVPGADEAAFLTAAKGTEALVRRQPGFLSRHLSKGADGRWTDAVTWASLAEAEAAPQAVMADPDFAPFMALIDGPSAKMRHEKLALTMA
jgi:antibiotic biosynthesis monooxygenase (ABM) superfamily enzyme